MPRHLVRAPVLLPVAHRGEQHQARHDMDNARNIQNYAPPDALPTGSPDETAPIPPGRLSTGIQWLDIILRGGIPENRVYLIMGDPGTGKTTLSLQFLLEGVARGERTLF